MRAVVTLGCTLQGCQRSPCPLYHRPVQGLQGSHGGLVAIGADKFARSVVRRSIRAACRAYVAARLRCVAESATSGGY